MKCGYKKGLKYVVTINIPLYSDRGGVGEGQRHRTSRVITVQFGPSQFCKCVVI